MMERELKLTAADERILEAILNSNLVRTRCVSDPDERAHQFTAIYYDSQDLELERARCGLRARQEGDRLRAAMKLPGQIVDGLSERMEFEATLTTWPARFRDFPEGDLLNALSMHIDLDSPMVERVNVSMERSIRILEIDTTRIELVSDHGIITGLSGQQGLDEVELELKDGPVEPMLALGEALKNQFNLRYSTATKLGIGLSLC